MEILYLLLGTFAVALLCPLFVGKKSGWGWALAALPTSLFVLLLRRLPDVSFDSGPGQEITLEWLPTLDVSMMLYLDGLSLFFGLIISFVGILIVVYAAAYFQKERYVGRFYMIILLFMGAMLGVVLAGNLLTMFVFWELTSFTSYLLIGWKHEDEKSRWAALQSLLVTAGGGLALLAGIILLRFVVGSFDIPEVLTSSEAIRSHPAYLAIIGLVALGAFTKSAQVPFHFWLPGAMAAPTPVSAYLHSATMVKAGIYLLARLHPALSGSAEWQTLVIAVGGSTMVLGAAQALPQHDLKRLLAYTTISALGMITMLIGVGTRLAIEAGMVFLLVHSLYKGSLFMVAGGLDHEAKTRDARRLSGLGRRMPLTAAAAILAALSMSGLPPLFGFIGKELVYDAGLHAPRWAGILTAAAVFANAVNVTIAIVVGVRPFFGSRDRSMDRVHEGSTGLWLGPLAAALLGLILGVFPGLVAGSIISPTVSSVLAESIRVKLGLWHGWKLPLLLSGVTIVAGVAFWLVRAWFVHLGERTKVLRPLFPSVVFQASLKGFLGLSGKATRILQNGNLGNYLITIFTVVLIGLGSGIVAAGHLDIQWILGDLTLVDVTVALIMITAAFMTIKARSRLASVVALGVVGFGISLIYTLHGAPDVAITQIVVESLTVVLFVLVLYRLPSFRSFSNAATRVRDASIASLVGLLMATVVLLKDSGRTFESVSRHFVEKSVSEAHGRNIVNVILVDFRGLDTMGEITVLAVAALGVYAMLKLQKETQDE